MSDVVRVSPKRLEDLVSEILVAHNTSFENARIVARALVKAQGDGQNGHGLSRVEAYARQAQSGKVAGHAIPKLTEITAAIARVDAGYGFAFPALNSAIDWLITRTASTGIAAVGIYKSHHFGAAGHVVERLAEAGLLAFVFGNSPKAIAAWGGSGPFFGTNPIAFAAPRAEGHMPLVVDMSLSKVARGKIMHAAKMGMAIEPGIAVDAQGKSTTDAKAALGGAMLPMGDAKGAALVLMVEILASALVGAHFSHEATSFFDAQGDPPGVGQFIIAINPGPVSGGDYLMRLEALIAAMLAQDGVRLPGSRREAARIAVAAEGIAVPVQVLEGLEALCQSNRPRG